MSVPNQRDRLRQGNDADGVVGERSQKADEIKKRLGDEYKILQDKIDKIGAFRFTIKGWSITALIAALAAVGNARSLSLTSQLVRFYSQMICPVKLL